MDELYVILYQLMSEFLCHSAHVLRVSE